MKKRTLLIELDPLPQRTMKLLLESVNCEVHVLSDTKGLLELTNAIPFDIVIVSTLSSIRDPLLLAEQAKRFQPLTRLILWGPDVVTLNGAKRAYVDAQVPMPCSLVQLKLAMQSRQTQSGLPPPVAISDL